MIRLSLSELCAVLDADLAGADCDFEAVSTDSRNLPEKSLFAALKGERFDAHDFIDQALCEKATALLVSEVLDFDIPQLVVKDTRIALGQLAGYVRDQLDIKAVAITGSNGKTSVKEMAASILSQRYSVLFTAGNFNNDIGLPLTLLRLEYQHQAGVFELGANRKGEIDYTSGLVKPDVALVNNIGAAHLEGFGTVNDVARAKSEIYHHLRADGIAIINLDDDFAGFLTQVAADNKIIYFGLNEAADVRAEAVCGNEAGEFQFELVTPGGRGQIRLGLPGAHQVINALAAAAIATALNIEPADIRAGLENLKPVRGRMQPHQLGRLLLIDDSYNANPSSVKAAINWLAERENQRVLVLGELAELGRGAKTMLGELGQYARQQNIHHVITLGDDISSLSAACGGRHFSQIDELIEYLRKRIFTRQGRVNLLVKGSRSAQMERVVEALLTAHKSGELN